MGKYLYNTMTEARVPHNPAMKVEQNKNLEWRDEKDVVVTDKKEVVTEATPPQDVVEKAGDDPIERKKAIVDACLNLDAETKGNFTAGGAPNVKPLSVICGFQVSASERDEIWAAVGPQE
jgi:hypothetical protein